MKSIKWRLILTALCLVLLMPGLHASANNSNSEKWAQEIDNENYSSLYVTNDGDILLAVFTDTGTVFDKYEGETGELLSSFELERYSQVLRDEKKNLYIYYFDTKTYELALYDISGNVLWKQPYPKLPGDNAGEYLGFTVSVSDNLLHVAKADRDTRSFSLLDGSFVGTSPHVEDPRHAMYPYVSLEYNKINYQYKDKDRELQSTITPAGLPDHYQPGYTYINRMGNQTIFYIEAEDVTTKMKFVYRKVLVYTGRVQSTDIMRYQNNFRPYTIGDFIYLNEVELTHEIVLIDGRLDFYIPGGSKVHSTVLGSEEIDLVTGIDKKYLFVIAGNNAFLFKNDGELVWKKDISASFDERGYVSYIQPTNQIDPTKIYVEHGENLIQLDKNTGEILWTQDAGRDGFGYVNIHEPSNTIFYKKTDEAGIQRIHAVNIESMDTVKRDKMWTVTFSDAVNPESVNEKNIYIVGADNEKVSVTYEVNKNKVYIHPPVNGFTAGEKYTLYVEQGVTSLSGKSLKTKADKLFRVE